MSVIKFCIHPVSMRKIISQRESVHHKFVQWLFKEQTVKRNEKKYVLSNKGNRSIQLYKVIYRLRGNQNFELKQKQIPTHIETDYVIITDITDIILI